MMQLSLSRDAASCCSRPKSQSSTRSVKRCALNVRAEAVAIPDKFTKVQPKGDRVLVKVAPQEEKTTGGILLPSSAQKRPTSGDVVALGDGRGVDGTIKPFVLEEGDTVLYSKFGFMYTDLLLGDDEFILIREDDVIGVMPKSNASAADIPQLRPVGDRLLVKVDDTADVTIGGVILPEAAKERPVCGTVVRTGPGKYDKERDPPRQPPPVKEGDRVLYFKYAGDSMETPEGDKYVVLREDDVLCKA